MPFAIVHHEDDSWPNGSWRYVEKNIPTQKRARIHLRDYLAGALKHKRGKERREEERRWKIVRCPRG